MVPELVHTFETTVKFIEQSVADLTEQKMVEQPTGVPNHAMWTRGHIICSCQGVAAELGAEQWLPDHWEIGFRVWQHTVLGSFALPEEIGNALLLCRCSESFSSDPPR